MSDAIFAHEIAIEQHGGRNGIHDIGLVESAISRPYSGYYRQIHQKVAALIQSTAGNHGFVDGNKRTALILAHMIVERSGYMIAKRSTNEDEDDVEHLILDMTTHFLDFDQVCGWLKSQIRPIDQP